MRSSASWLTLLACLGFVLAIIAYMISLPKYYFGWEKQPRYNWRIIAVNAPDSFTEFIEEEMPDVASDVVYKKHDAVYDAMTFTSWMEDEYAYLTIVFPKDFDRKVFREEQKKLPEILTYYPVDHPEYADMQERFTSRVLTERYLPYIQEQLGIPTVDQPITDAQTKGFFTGLKTSGSERIGRLLVPLLFFVSIMYACMLCGMNAIAGEKERGTFSALLMTPIPRMTIVMGNYIGVVLHALIPCAVLLFPLVFFIRPAGVLGILLLSLSLSLFIAGVTIMISCMNNTIISAQTTFLPIFLIFLVVCVTCMQQTNRNALQPYLPIYGHFYGIGDCVTGTVAWPSLLLCTLITLILGAICIFVSKCLLQTETFTVSIESKSEKEARKAAARAKKEKKDYVASARADVFHYKPKKRVPIVRFLIRHALLPLALLSFFQTLAMIPAITAFMRDPNSNDFIRMFREVRNMNALPDIMKASGELFAGFMQNNYFILFMGIGYWLIIGTYLLFVRFLEKNSLETTGFASRAALSERGKASPVKAYLRGMLIGLLMISSVYVLLLVFGQIESVSFALDLSSLPLFLLYILMWIPQGATEEIMMRGFMLPRISARFGIPFGIFFSSMCFSLMHMMNAGYSVLALINLFLIAAFFALWALKDGHIYMVCAMHTVWNFCQGNLFGLQVSGNAQSATVLESTYSSSSRALMTGGEFGPEGGLCVTIVVCVALLVLGVLTFRPKKKKPLNV